MFALKNFIGPRKDTQHNYPLDLDGSLRYTRPYVIDMFPYPTPIGMVSGFMHEMDAFVFAAYGAARTPYGPNINSLPSYAEYQIAVPGLFKKA